MDIKEGFSYRTHAGPAAPSSGEVEDAFAYITPHPENHSAISLSANKLRGYVNTLRAHIAALEADNKRLREALTKYATADVTCSYADVSSRAYEVHEHCEKWAQAALAQTDGLKECQVCDGAGYHLIPTTGHGCCGSFLSSGECCGNAVQVDTGLEEQPCIACDGTGKESLAQTDGKAGA